MSLNTIVKQKRKELGLTQEQVADFLGVSTPAVNKWEKGSTCPDIALLPALARLLKTDLNTLLCFHEKMSQKEISLFLKCVTELFHKEGLDSAFKIAMEKVREYPVNAELIQYLALALQGCLVMTEMDSSQKEPYHMQITSLYERVTQCNDPGYSNNANYMLASRLICEGKYHKAQEKLDSMPEYNALDKRNLQAQLWLAEGKVEEAAALLEHKLMTNLQDVQVSLVSLAKISLLEDDERNAVRIAQCGQKTIELFGLWEYSAFVVPLETAVVRKDIEGSLSILRDMLTALCVPWDMGKSPVCRHIQRSKTATDTSFGKQLLPVVLCELEKEPTYDFLRKEPEFQRLLSQYRLTCSQNMQRQ